MKPFLTFLFIFFEFTLVSQNLSLDELISLRKKELANAEEFLTNKNWSLLSATEPKDSTMGIVIFAYDKSRFDDKAQSFLKYMYSNKSQIRRLSIQVNKKDIYNSYLARLKSLGCKIVSSKIENGEIIKIYEGATIIFEISVATLKDGLENTKTYYNFFLVEKNDYYMNFIDE